ncbi:hypothetical protein NDU88_001805 [Pleurodeles waltl]|uniref:Uncharacterized protein n=1 Tax=Pleurodeles waltl TaxID=8319 RepID=A0AAV7MLF4_PLEWA|nr:hypothetical protein NDU88_001805 [Pleurodeles waltl]
MRARPREHYSLYEAQQSGSIPSLQSANTGSEERRPQQRCRTPRVTRQGSSPLASSSPPRLRGTPSTPRPLPSTPGINFPWRGRSRYPSQGPVGAPCPCRSLVHSWGI